MRNNYWLELLEKKEKRIQDEKGFRSGDKKEKLRERKREQFTTLRDTYLNEQNTKVIMSR